MTELFSLTGRPLQVLTASFAVLLPLLAVFLWTRHRTETGPRFRRITAVVGRLAVVGLAVVTAMGALFLFVNNSFGFYASWSDLSGVQDHTPQAISMEAGPGQPDGASVQAPQTTGVNAGPAQSAHVRHARERISLKNLNPGKGSLKVLGVRDSGGITNDVLIWLPPRYNATAAAKLPVVMFLPGQPSTAVRTYNHFNFGTDATKAITSGKMKPFIGVFPPIMLAPPRDTECVDVPGGPQAETWLTDTVPQAVAAKYRAEPTGSHWAVLGFSTGALCAAKLVLRYPDKFKAGVAFGGQYEPYFDHTTGDLFHGDQQLEDNNSSRWLYSTYGMRGSYLLMVSSTHDEWAWRQTQQMAAATAGDPNVTLFTVPKGPHFYTTYNPRVPAVLKWLAARKVFG